MKLQWIIVFCALLGVTIARPDNDDDRSYGHHSGEDNSYEFKYDVSNEDSSEEKLKYGHHERKSEDKVEGGYYVLLPNGLLQQVSYYVEDDSGFVAKVEYHGSEEEHSEEKHSYGKDSDEKK